VFGFLFAGNHLLESSSLLRNPYQASPGGNINAASDIELMDPAILAVGKGRLPSGVNNSGMDMRPNIHVQAPLFENDSRLQLLMRRSLSHRQSLRCTKVGDNFVLEVMIMDLLLNNIWRSHSKAIFPCLHRFLFIRPEIWWRPMAIGMLGVKFKLEMIYV